MTVAIQGLKTQPLQAKSQIGSSGS